jgi:hypothetical protein
MLLSRDFFVFDITPIGEKKMRKFPLGIVSTGY